MKSKWYTLPAAAAFLTLAACGAPTQAAQLDDQAIVGIYNQVNSFDIETALLGETKAASPEVRALATMVSRDHTGVRRSIYRLAVENGFAPVLPQGRHTAAAEHYAVIEELRGVDGAAFDKAYLRHEIAFHEGAIKAVREILLPSAASTALKAHFEKVLPAFEHHLAETRRVAKELGYVN